MTEHLSTYRLNNQVTFARHTLIHRRMRWHWSRKRLCYFCRWRHGFSSLCECIVLVTSCDNVHVAFCLSMSLKADSYLIVCLWRRGARHGDEAFKKVSSVQPSADRQVKVCWQFLYKWAIFDCWENPRPEGSLRPVVRFIGKVYFIIVHACAWKFYLKVE